MNGIEIDFSDQAVIDDPFPALRRLMDAEPVHWNPGLGGWCLTRYEDVRQGYLDPRFSADRVKPFLDGVSGLAPARRAALADMVTRWMVFTDPPTHTRLRKLTASGFTLRAIRRLRGRIALIVHELVDRVAGRGECDLIADIAYPLPATVIAEMLGVPHEDVDDLKRWSDDLATYVLTSRRNTGRHAVAADSAMEMRDYFARLIARRRRHPGDAIIDDLIAARDGADRLSEEELLAGCAFLLFAGHETTTQLFGNGMVALLRHPAQMRELAAGTGDAALVENAVEELLRYDGPTLSMVRVMTEDVELHGRTLRRGDRVYLFSAAAGRDPRIFPEPDRLDLRRANARRHLSFGFGIHHCLGAQLARMEGVTALPILLDRLPGLALATDRLVWSDSIVIRGVTRLPVTFQPTPAEPQRQARR